MRPLALADFDWALDNPVIVKELRSRMRGAKAYWLLLGYLLVLSLTMFLSYLGWWTAQTSGSAGNAPTSFAAGREFFSILFYVQASLVSLITPALTSGAISIEREQRTFELVRCTTLSPRAIVLGKLFSSVSFVVLLLICSLPLVSLCFLLGGVAPDEVFFSYAMLICDAFLFGAFGIVWSTCAANTAAATALAYGTLFGFFFLTVTFSFGAILPRGVVAFGLSAVNPIGAVTCAATMERYFRLTMPAWVPGLLLNGLLTAVLCLISINRLEDYPWRRATALRVTTFVFIALLVFFLDGATVARRAPNTTYDLVAMGIAALMLFGSPFTTGDSIPDGETRASRRLLTFNPVAAFREATLRNSVSTAILLSVMLVIETALVLHATSNNGVVVKSSGGGLSVVGIVAAVACLYVSTGLTIAGVGVLLSLLFRNRWASVVFTYLVLTLTSLVPSFTYQYLTLLDIKNMSHPAWINMLYVSPIAALDNLCSPSTQPAFRLLAFADTVPAWVVTACLWSVVGILLLVLAESVAKKMPSTDQ